MLYFFDTSALVKWYHKETGTSIVDKILRDLSNRVTTASLTWAETVSALNKIRNRNLITADELDIALSKLSDDYYSGRIQIIDIQRKHILQSHDLILEFNLIASDAVILACATELKPFDPIFVCSDIRSGLLRAAERTGLSTLNPIA